MTTIRDLITDAYREIGIIALEEQPTAAEAQDGLTRLKRMLSGWSTDTLTVFASSPSVFDLVPGKGVYTIGTGGDFNIPRPDKISNAYMRSPQGYDYPVFVSNDYTDYASITVKNVTSTLPIFLYNDNEAPLQNVYLWPVPSDNVNKLVLWTSNPIGSYTTLDDIVTLPDGYEDAIVYNLALRMCSSNGVQASAELVKAANDTKAIILSANYQAQTMIMDDAITGRGIYNILTDKPVGRIN